MIDRFPDAWLEFQGQTIEKPGTPLEISFHEMIMSRNERQKYEMAGVTTWEEIAELSDAGCESIGFGTRKKREEVMRELGRTPPGKPPDITLSPMMTAEQALLTLPGGQELVNRLNSAIAEKNGEAPAQTSAAMPGIDMADPDIAAAVQAAIAVVMKSREPAGASVAVTGSSLVPETPVAPPAAPDAPVGVKKGWPLGKPRGPRKTDAAAA